MVRPYTDDPVADFDAWDAEQARLSKALPVCSECDEAIADDFFYEINDEPICEGCMERNHRKAVSGI